MKPYKKQAQAGILPRSRIADRESSNKFPLRMAVQDGPLSAVDLRSRARALLENLSLVHVFRFSITACTPPGRNSSFSLAQFKVPRGPSCLKVSRGPSFLIKQKFGSEIVGFLGSKRPPPTGEAYRKRWGASPTHLFFGWSPGRRGLFRPPKTADFRTDFLKMKN